MRSSRVLVLGGTQDARAMAHALTNAGFQPTTSLAGVTGNPVLPEGDVRIGGFGGADGLAAYLVRESMAAVVDATHPFAARMAAQAFEACRVAAIPLLRLERPPWRARDGDRWISVSSVSGAVAALPPGARAMVTIGRKEIAPFLVREDISGIARMIEEPGCHVPPGWTVVLARPPFAEEDERRLMIREAITHLVSKNAGGASTESKLMAARTLGLPVIMIERPQRPDVQGYPREADLVAALRQMLLS